MSENLIYGFGGLLFFQAYVTVRVVQNGSSTRAQKRRQLMLVWLVPFIGAAFVLASLATNANTP